MTLTGATVLQRVIGFAAVSGNGRNVYLLGTNCRECDQHPDPMFRNGKPCVWAYWHAVHTVDRWRDTHWQNAAFSAHVEPVYADVDPAVDVDRDPADRLVDAINTNAQQRADREAADWSSWVDTGLGRQYKSLHYRYVAVLRGVRAERTGEREVTVTAPDTTDGRQFGYVAGELIDGACEDVDPNGEVFQMDTAYIDPVVDRQRYVFTW